MKSTNYIGFFQDPEKLQKAANSFQIAGFQPSDLIIQNSDEHPLMLCVPIGDQYDEQMAHNIFKFYGVNHIDEIGGLIQNAEELRKIISIHSRQQIFTPKPTGSHRRSHEGMNAEVHTFNNE